MKIKIRKRRTYILKVVSKKVPLNKSEKLILTFLIINQKYNTNCCYIPYKLIFYFFLLITTTPKYRTKNKII